MPRPPRVVVVRGHQSNPWELRPWELLADRYDVSYLRTGRTWFDPSLIGLDARPVRALRDLLPPGRLGDTAVRLPGDRYLGARDALAGADVVHSQELGYWYSDQAARLKDDLGFKLVLTVWETLPFRDAYRNVRTRPYRRRVLAATDLFLPTTERARLALELEGADPARIRVAAPGVDVDRFTPGGGPAPDPPVILSAGRLVWEKGHQDVIRALAVLRRDGVRARAVLLGQGPEGERLARYAHELGVGDAVEVRAFIPYDQMPQVYAQASCLVLASIPIWSWEEQFGMVLAEAIAAGLPIVASSSGAIPEVAGPTARYVTPGDWAGLAGALRETLAAGRPGEVADPERVRHFSVHAAADRLAAAYNEVLR